MADHVLHPASCGDDSGGGFVDRAAQIGPSERPAFIALVEPGLVVAARAAPAGSAFGPASANVTGILALARGLLLGPPAHVLFQPPRGHTAFSCCSPLGPQLLLGLLDLARYLGPLEVIQECVWTP